MSIDIAGVWKLRSYSRRFLDTGEVRDDMLPHAYILYTPGGHIMSITVEADRKPPAGSVLTDQERIRLFNSVISAWTRSSGTRTNISRCARLPNPSSPVDARSS